MNHTDREVQQSSWVDTWAGHVKALGFSSLALPLLEIIRPFALLGSQALLAARPLVAGFADDPAIDRVITLLDSPELLDRLERGLEGDPNHGQSCNPDG